MERRRTFVCPVDLGELDHLPRQARHALLRFLQCDGVGRVSVVARGGDDRRPLSPEDDEAMFIEGSDGPFQRRPEERYGRHVRNYVHAIY